MPAPKRQRELLCCCRESSSLSLPAPPLPGADAGAQPVPREGGFSDSLKKVQNSESNTKGPRPGHWVSSFPQSTVE